MQGLDKLEFKINQMNTNIPNELDKYMSFNELIVKLYEF